MIYASAAEVKKVISVSFPLKFRQNQTTRFIFDLTALSMSDWTSLKSLIAILENVQAQNIQTCILGVPTGLRILLAHKSVASHFEEVEIFESFVDLRQSRWFMAAPSSLDLSAGKLTSLPAWRCAAYGAGSRDVDRPEASAPPARALARRTPEHLRVPLWRI